MEIFGVFGLLYYIGLPIFVVYVAFTIINLMKQKNEYLKEIRNELEKLKFK